MKDRKAFKIIRLILIIAGTASALFIGFSLIVSLYVKNYNRNFPEKYIAENYPETEILETQKTGDMLLNPTTYHYYCFDNEKSFAFEQTFYENKFGKLYAADDNPNSYNNMLLYREAFDKCIEKVPEYYDGDYFTRYSPDGMTGFSVFLKNDDFERIMHLYEGLESAVKGEFFQGDSRGEYVEFSIISCDEKIYNMVNSADYSLVLKSPEFSQGYASWSGFKSFDSILNIQSDWITSDESNLYIRFYECDENFLNQYGYDSLVREISGEPNADEADMIVYGIKLN